MVYTGSQSRFGIFLNKCAPIQINFLGYPGTSGAKSIDYIIADKIVIPENKKQLVEFFKEKPDGDGSWINGGFFVVEPEIFKFIKDDQTILEKEPLEKISKNGDLVAFLHKGFWQCMDHKIDKVRLDELCKKKKIPWLIKKEF